MTPDEWAQVKSLFGEAMDQPPGERNDFISCASGVSEAVRAEVASLVAAADGPDSIPSARTAIASAATRSALQGALGAQYEIVQSLGHGGMGAVYLARDRALDRFVAIKVLRSDLSDASGTRERFRREARIAAQLSHPNILPLFTFGEIGGLWYFITRYVRGVSLAERLRVEGRLPVADAIRILRELTDALDHAHRSGVIHRDIKPANILLDADNGHAVLADFGISKLESETMTHTGAVIGTPSYMSPEQARASHEADERSDIYSLSAVALEMLGGRDVAMNDPGARKLLAIAMRGLEPDPARRWQSASALRDALARAADETGSGGSPTDRELPTFAPYAFFWLVIWMVISASPGRPLRDRTLLVITALVVPFGLVVHLWSARGDDVPLSEAIRSALRPPDWWSLWWPRRLRTRNDVWPRLPFPARLVRIVLSAAIVAVPGIVLARRWVTATAAPSGWVDDTQGALVVAAALALILGFTWALYKRVSPKDTVRLVIGATSENTGWASPAMQRILLPPDNGVIAPMSETPAEYRRAIMAAAMQASDDDAEGARAHANTATSLAAAIDRIDTELAVLSRDASASELNRLASQLAALEAAESEAQRELSELVRRQLEIVRRMQLDAELLAQERARLFASLRGEWRQVSNLSS